VGLHAAAVMMPHGPKPEMALEDPKGVLRLPPIMPSKIHL
jgi:hypothetical protein